MLLNRIRPAVDIILRTNKNGSRTNRSTLGKYLRLEELSNVQMKKIWQLLSFSSILQNFRFHTSKKYSRYTQFIRYTR